jgi:UDP-N-acetylmuramoyl-L-alanyl-D-glutamate--2,6-diaminopimelate ligase
MEVSSHALELRRVDGTHFRVAVFTNLGRDHLDFHRDSEAYFSAKARLFTSEFAERAVICVDDEYGRRLAGSITIPVVTYSCADLAADIDLVSSRFTWRGLSAALPLGGRFNVCNAIAAAEAAAAVGLDPTEIVAGLAEVSSIPGRFESVDAGQDFTVLVDYAHTPEGLEQLLTAVSALTDGRITVVFGCGGDRDRSKRPEMGAVASRHADQVIVTSDNPRGEDPMTIIEEVLAGIPRGGAAVEVDRRDAINRALAAAAPGDSVVIAGKGHETTQDLGAEVVAFDDREVTSDELARLLARKGDAG